MTTVNFSRMTGRFLWFVAAPFPWNRKKLFFWIVLNDKNAPPTIAKFTTDDKKHDTDIQHQSRYLKSPLGQTRAILFLFPLKVRLSGVLPYLWMSFCKPTTTNLTMVFDSHSCANQWNDVEHKQQGNRNADCVRTVGKRQLAPVVVFVT